MTNTQAKAGLAAIMAISDAIHELRSVPSGKLYATVMSVMRLEQFNKVIDILKDAGVVREDSMHVLNWID